MHILISVDGSDDGRRAAMMLHQLGVTRGADITVLGVAATPTAMQSVQQSMSAIEDLLKDSTASYQIIVEQGHPADRILEEAIKEDYDLVTIPRAAPRRFPNPIKERTTRKLARLIPSHILLARNVPDKIERILVCSGAESPSEETIRTAGELTSRSGAEFSVLHVMSQVALRPDSPAQDLAESADEAIERHTPEGEHLDEAIGLLRKVGVDSEIKPILRHGLVVGQVKRELESKDYDLLVIGSHYQPALNRWLDVLLEDVAGDLIAQTSIPTLVIHHHGPFEDLRQN